MKRTLIYQDSECRAYMREDGGEDWEPVNDSSDGGEHMSALDLRVSQIKRELAAEEAARVAQEIEEEELTDEIRECAGSMTLHRMSFPEPDYVPRGDPRRDVV